MKSTVLTVVFTMLLSVSADAAAPLPAVAHFRITCVVDQRAQWPADRRAADMPQRRNRACALMINTAPATLVDTESFVEMEPDGSFEYGSNPVEIIISQESLTVKTITACWKI